MHLIQNHAKPNNRLLASKDTSKNNMSDFRSLQSAELAIYKDIAELCEEYGFEHYALGGTLLGAVRHQGFIPWDDDIDIVIPRPQYDEFLRIAKEKLSSRYDVVSYKNSDNRWVPRFFCQIHAKILPFDLEMAKETEHTTPWVDVMPLDAMPSNALLRQVHKVHLLKKRMDSQLAGFDKVVHQSRIDRPLYEKAIIRFSQLTGFGQDKDARRMLASAEVCAKQYSYDEEDWVVNLYGAYKFREMFPKAWFADPVFLPFEDIEMPCPKEFEKVLIQLYGDWMTPPPDHEKNARHRHRTESM